MNFVITLITYCFAVSNASVLDMSRQLWSRALSGGFDRIGKLDPLIIPVVKIDQTEGNTSYRVFLRNLRITGLNQSSIESVHIAKGKLKSNLSDGEAGYVSYNKQKDLDAIRYRFHTLVKERKSQSSEDESAEQFLEFDPIEAKAREEDDDIAESAEKELQRRRYISQKDGSKSQEKPQQQESDDDAVFEFNYGEGKVASNPNQRNPSTVRIIYKNNGRPCIGVCKQSPGTIETRNYNNPEQSYNFPSSTQVYGSVFSYENPSPQLPSQFSVRASQRQFHDTTGVKTHRPNSSGIKGNNKEATVQQPGNHQNHRPENVSGVKGHNSPANINEPHNQGIKGQTGSVQFPVVNPRIPDNHRYNDNQEPISVGVKGSHGNPQFEAGNKGVKDRPQSPTSNPGIKYQGPQRGTFEGYTYRPPQHDRSNSNPIKNYDQSGESRRTKVSPGLHNRYSQPTPVQYVDAVYPPYYPQAFRIEQQPGFIDIEYASKTKSRKLSTQSAELQSATNDDPKMFKIEILKKKEEEEDEEEDLMHVIVKVRVPRVSVDAMYALTGKVGKQVLRGSGLLVGNFTPGVQVCPRNENYNECVKKQLEVLTPYLKKGIPAMKLPALDPLLLPSLTIDRNLESLKIKANMSNIQVFGGSNYIIDEIKANPDELTVSLKIQVPSVHVRGNYDVQGRLLLLPLAGIGTFKGNFNNVHAKAQLKFQTVERRGRKLLYFPTMTTKVVIKDYTANFQPGITNPISLAINAVLENSRPEIIESMTPSLEKAISEKVLDVANRICKHFTFDELFPDRE
ncbi:unnamed protein product [Trichogramma brassicae]|uniref:Lipid-binding serum glycoprotein N-terminal domain-containing protein n=1 Tax=Trichogramma brassicae TaxID=86971 RepID=A0A6H5IJU1_9HYME|nr:unnamed protein product [Trichogramma brassicae]